MVWTGSRLDQRRLEEAVRRRLPRRQMEVWDHVGQSRTWGVVVVGTVVALLCHWEQHEGEAVLACWRRCGVRKQAGGRRAREGRREDHQDQKTRQVSQSKRRLLRGLLEDLPGCVWYPRIDLRQVDGWAATQRCCDEERPGRQVGMDLD